MNSRPDLPVTMRRMRAFFAAAAIFTSVFSVVFRILIAWRCGSGQMEALTATIAVVVIGFLPFVALGILMLQTFFACPRTLRSWCIFAVCAVVVSGGRTLGHRLDSVFYNASVRKALGGAGEVEVIRSEGLALLRLYDSETRQRGKRVPGIDIPEPRWPPTIAKVRPYDVRVIPRYWIALHVGMRGRVRTEILIGTNGIPVGAEELYRDVYLVTH